MVGNVLNVWQSQFNAQSRQILADFGADELSLDDRLIGWSFEGYFDQAVPAPEPLLKAEAEQFYRIRPEELEAAARTLKIFQGVGSTAVDVRYKAELATEGFHESHDLHFSADPRGVFGYQVHRRMQHPSIGRIDRTLKNSEATEIGLTMTNMLPVIVAQMQKENELINREAAGLVDSRLLGTPNKA